MAALWTYGDASHLTVTRIESGVVYSVEVGDPEVQAWIAAGNTPDPYVPPPPPVLSRAQNAGVAYNHAIAAGLTVIWNTSTTLNGTYGIAPSDQFNIDAETTSILLNGAFTNGQTTKVWPDQTLTFHNFSIPQFKAFATAVSQYIDALVAAAQAAAAGQSAAWPSATVTINL